MPNSRPNSGRRQLAHPRSGNNHPGIHFLRSPRVVHDLVASCSPKPGDLVVDLGAGLGAITDALARTGANVLAVERDPRFARKLADRFSGSGNVRVVTGDARTFALPRKDFLVVSSIPYAASTALLRRLLDPWPTRLHQAALVVEWGFAKRVTAAVPRNRELAWWAARFQLEIVRRVPARCFQPPPAVDSARLHIRRRPPLGKAANGALWTLLDTAYRAPQRPARAVAAALTGHRTHRALLHSGIDPAAPAATVRPQEWARLATALTNGGSRARATRGR